MIELNGLWNLFPTTWIIFYLVVATIIIEFFISWYLLNEKWKDILFAVIVSNALSFIMGAIFLAVLYI